MTPSVFLAAMLLLIGLVILSLELFLPSAGMLSLLALFFVFASLYIAFLVSSGVGWTFLAIDIVLALILPSIGIELWKRSPIGKRMFLADPKADGPPTKNWMESLKGEVGRTVTPLRPSGNAEIVGRRVQVQSEGMIVDADTMVRVIEVQGNRIVVRPLEGHELPGDELT